MEYSIPLYQPNTSGNMSDDSVGVPPTWVAHVVRSADAIGWTSLPSDASFGCIHPPPFGRQCTIPREQAIASCMAMPHCVAITCPEPRESHIGERGITGPVCQLRARRTPDEKRHGMCRPGGCINIALSRIPRPPGLHNWEQMSALSRPLRNPALLFLHGDQREHALLMPPNIGLYWPVMQRHASTGGMLFAVDAVPLSDLNASDSSHAHYRRHDLWVSERGGGLGRRHRRRGK